MQILSLPHKLSSKSTYCRSKSVIVARVPTWKSTVLSSVACISDDNEQYPLCKCSFYFYFTHSQFLSDEGLSFLHHNTKHLKAFLYVLLVTPRSLELRKCYCEVHIMQRGFKKISMNCFWASWNLNPHNSNMHPWVNVLQIKFYELIDVKIEICYKIQKLVIKDQNKI